MSLKAKGRAKAIGRGEFCSLEIGGLNEPSFCPLCTLVFSVSESNFLILDDLHGKMRELFVF